MQILAQPALLIEWESEDKPDRQHRQTTFQYDFNSTYNAHSASSDSR